MTPVITVRASALLHEFEEELLDLYGLRGDTAHPYHQGGIDVLTRMLARLRSELPWIEQEMAFFTRTVLGSSLSTDEVMEAVADAVSA